MKRLLKRMFNLANSKPRDVKCYYDNGSLKAHITVDGIAVWDQNGKLRVDTRVGAA